jgi:hypothetical protein
MKVFDNKSRTVCDDCEKAGFVQICTEEGYIYLCPDCAFALVNILNSKLAEIQRKDS